MTITSAAADVIRRWLRASSEITRPVIYLGVASNTPAAVEEAIKGGAAQEEIRAITLRTMSSEPRYLYPLVYPSSHFIWLTSTINGFRFASHLFYPRHVRHALKTGVLDVAERGLVLKDANGTVVLPKNAVSAL